MGNEMKMQEGGFLRDERFPPLFFSFEWKQFGNNERDFSGRTFFPFSFWIFFYFLFWIFFGGGVDFISILVQRSEAKFKYYVSGRELLRGLFMDVFVEETGTRKCTCSTDNSIPLFNF